MQQCLIWRIRAEAMIFENFYNCFVEKSSKKVFSKIAENLVVKRCNHNRQNRLHKVLGHAWDSDGTVGTKVQQTSVC